MWKLNRLLAVVVLGIGLAGIGIGIGFVAEAQIKSNWMKEQMQAENITLGLTADQIAKGQVVDSAAEAQKAADTIREHRHKNFGTYSEALGGQSFDPNNPKEVTYMQALNLENYLYLAVTGFGVATVVLGAGIFMIIVGVALCAGGFAVFRLAGARAAAG